MTDKAIERTGKKKGRSPNYPAIDLETALEKAHAIMAQENQHYAHIATLYAHWGYGTKSSTGNVTLAALKKFGLMEDKGSGDAREARITNLAHRILVDDRPDSTERIGLIRQAALNPSIHRKLWDDYQGRLPSEANLRYRLRTEEKFTEGGVDDFIREFKSTIAFAKLEESDSVSVHDEDKTPVEEEKAMPAAQPVRSSETSASFHLGVSAPEAETKFEVGLSGGQITYFRAPPSMTEAEWGKISALINLLAPVKSKSDPEARDNGRDEN